jgi:molybdenum cofactor cytidylyltransferase
MSRPELTAVIPAAGLSSRMGPANKLLMDIDGVPVIVRVVRAALMCPVSRVLVVTGHDSENVFRALESLPVRIVNNPLYKTGMGSSLIQGVREAGVTDGYLVWPGDMPFIRPETVAAICEAHDSASIVVPGYRGRRGHPVLFGGHFRDPLLKIRPEHGARSVMNDNPDSVTEVEVEDTAVLRDIDSPRDITDLE